jgi:hypothetical protein
MILIYLLINIGMVRKKIIRLTENDLNRIVKKVLNESTSILFPIGNDNFNVGYDSQGLGSKINPKVLDRYDAIHNSDYGGGDAAHRSRGGHKGIDIFAPKGTPLVACVNGVVSKIGNERTNPTGGNTVNILGDDGKNYYYAHLDSVRNDLSRGDKVNKGMFIGTVGSTGNARGKHPHLHFSIYKKDYNRGSIDPWPYLSNSLQMDDLLLIDKDDVVEKVDGVVTKDDLSIEDIMDNGDNSELLSVGSKGDGVVEVQTILHSLGYDIGSSEEFEDGIDGIYGFKTKRAVEEFQKDEGLLVDGIVGINTSSALYNYI